MVKHYHQALNRLLIAVLLLWSGEAFAQVNWPNEPPGATVLLDCGFADATCSGSLWIGSAPTIVSDGTAPLSPLTVGESRIVAGASDGGAWFGKTISPTAQSIYVGLWWKFSSPWEGANHGGNKLFFINSAEALSLMSFHNPPFSENYRVAWTTDGTQIDDANSHLDGIGVQSHFGLGCTVTPGEWIRLEVYMRASTTWTDQSGIVRWWVNGQLCGDYTNVNFPGGFVDWQNNQTWGGLDGISFPKPTIDWWHRFDHVRVSVPDCGAQGCPEPTPAWPNEPSGATTLLDWAFNTVAGSGLTDASGRGTIVSDSTAVLSPVNVLRSRLQNGITPGGVTLQYDLADLSEVFAGAWWKPNTTFQGDSNSLNHMMWFQKSGTPAAVGLVTWFGTSNAAGLSGSIQFHINDVDSIFNNCHLTGWVGNCPGPGRLTPNMSSCTVAATDDQWHRLEVYVRRSTSTTDRTGIVRWWLDGNLCGNYDPQAGTGVNWGPAGFDYWAWNEEWTTTPITQSADWIHYIDHLYISQPTGATTVDTMPPGPVTNFGVTTGGPPPPDPPPVGVSPGAEWFQFF